MELLFLGIAIGLILALGFALVVKHYDQLYYYSAARAGTPVRLRGEFFYLISEPLYNQMAHSFASSVAAEVKHPTGGVVTDAS